MSTKMDGIYQQSLFTTNIHMAVYVSENSRYRILANVLPWLQLAEIANSFRSKTVNINLGRTLDLRLHIGVYVAQSMNGWTDRETEEMIRYHAGVKILCGLEESSDTLDRTSIESFRNQLGKEACEALNKSIVLHAASAGFTGSELCASDTTVQEAPIAHPTEIGHMKKIAEKLIGIGKKLNSRVENSVKALGKTAKDLFTEMRLFVKGKTEKKVEKKKELSKKMYEVVSSMAKKIETVLNSSRKSIRDKHQVSVELYQKMLGQIIVWLKTGNHPANKLISLWEQNARAITKEKIGKTVEFGRRWVITRLLGGYVIGTPCLKLGSDSDGNIAEEVLIQFLNTFGELPEYFIYDRGGDGPKNHELLKNLGVSNNCIFRKGDAKMQVEDSVFEMVHKERSLNEASIANIKTNKYNFTKPRAKTMESCILKGHASMLGFNLNNFLKDVSLAWKMNPEIT